MPYIKKITISGFESHELSEISLCDGINVIRGDTDSGKSAIFRSLFWLVNNYPQGDSFIRYGVDCCSVSLDLDNGFTIIREKCRKNTNRYVIKTPLGEEISYDSIGSDPLTEVWNILGFGNSSLLGEDRVLLNFSEQGSPAFCVFDSGPEKARKISSFVSLDISDKAIKKLSSEIRESSQKDSFYQSELNSIISQINNIGDIQELEFFVENLERELDHISTIDREEKLLQDFYKRLQYLNEEEKLARDFIDKAEILLKSSPDIEDLTLIAYNIKELKTAKRKLEDIDRGINEETLKLDKINKDIEDLDSKYNSLLSSIDICPVCNRPLHTSSEAQWGVNEPVIPVENKGIKNTCPNHVYE